MALYPPIVASSMPAFGISESGEGSVKIYFTLSNYNNRKEIKAVHVSVRRQSSNANVLQNANQIIQADLKQTKEDKVLNRYYITLSQENLIENFQPNVFYKVQLRFSSKKVADKEFNASFLQNSQFFSQWSTVCLIKPVIKPKFYLLDFETKETEGYEDYENEENYYTSLLADFVGYYSPQNGKEILKNWRLRLLDSSYQEDNYSSIDTYTLADSGVVAISSYNYTLIDNELIFTCSLPYEFKTNDKDYKLLFEIQTRNGYTERKIINFTTKLFNINSPNVNLSYSINEEDGYVKIIISNEGISSTTNLVLRRTDSSSNFLKWEDLKFYKIFTTEEEETFVYYDFTAQSGTLYKYLVQAVDTRGRRSYPVYATYQKDGAREEIPGVLLEYDNAFLLEDTGNGDIQKVKQLKLKFDFQLSSYKYNVLESKTDTIGAKYPFIKRNGDMYYRSFDCSGTITGFMDEAELFVSKNTLYDNQKNLYDVFKGQILNYTQQYDYTYERKFREYVQEFLYNSKPKLYKTMQEGNMFIKLMNVSLSPKNELGRLIYTFSATAYEIAPSTIQTYLAYGLLDPGTYDPSLAIEKTTLGQLSSYNVSQQGFSNLFKAGQDIIGAGQAPAANSIAARINYNKTIDGMICNDFNIDWLRITVESNPYLIVKDDNGQYRPVEEDEEILDPTNPLYQMERTHNNFSGSVQSSAKIYLGTLFDLTINGVTESIIIAPPNNIYEINQSNLIFNGTQTSLVPRKDTLMSVEYNVNYTEQQDYSLIPIKTRVQDVIGQLELSHFPVGSEIISKIKYKYLYSYKDENGKMKINILGVPQISIDTKPGTMIAVMTTSNVGEEQIIINHTGELDIDLSASSNYITSYVIEDSVDALITYRIILEKNYYV